MIKKTITTLYHDQAAVHQKFVDMALVSETGLQLTFQGKKLYIGIDELKRATPAPRKYKDKKTGQDYQLFYFRWKEQEDEEIQKVVRDKKPEQTNLF